MLVDGRYVVQITKPGSGNVATICSVVSVALKSLSELDNTSYVKDDIKTIVDMLELSSQVFLYCLVYFSYYYNLVFIVQYSSVHE